MCIFKADTEGPRRRLREVLSRQTQGTLSPPGLAKSQTPPAAAAAAAAPKHIVVESLGVPAATELWRNPAMMNVVQQL